MGPSGSGGGTAAGNATSASAADAESNTASSTDPRTVVEPGRGCSTRRSSVIGPELWKPQTIERIVARKTCGSLQQIQST